MNRANAAHSDADLDRYLKMNMDKPKKMRPLIGIPIAVIALWVLGALGTFILIRSHHWFFLGNEDTLRLLCTEVLIFHACYFLSHLPAAFVAGIVISYTDVRQPCLTAAAPVMFLHIPILANWPIGGHPLPTWVPVVGHVTGMLILVISAALGVYWLQFCDRYVTRFGRDNNRLEHTC